MSDLTYTEAVEKATSGATAEAPEDRAEGALTMGLLGAALVLKAYYPGQMDPILASIAFGIRVAQNDAGVAKALVERADATFTQVGLPASTKVVEDFTESVRADLTDAGYAFA